MSYKIITINREFESAGSEVAQEVAKRLNLPYYDKFLITASAEQSGINIQRVEKTDEQLESRFEYSRAAATYQYSGGESPLPTGARVASVQFEMIRKFAEEGPCVIVGRCAGHVLRERDDVLRIFIHASQDTRIRRAMKNLNLSESAATRVTKQTDKARKAYHKNYTGLDWNDPDQYAMVLNTDILPEDLCADIICDLYKL